MDEFPAASDVNHTDSGNGASARPQLGKLLSMFGAVAALFVAALALTRGNIAEGIFAGIAGVGLILGRLAADERGASNANSSETNHRRRVFLIALVLLMLLIGAVTVFTIRWMRDPPILDGEIVGTTALDNYRNAYFGLQLPIGEDWQDVTMKARKKAADKPNAKNTAVLVALARAPLGKPEDGASLLFAAEALPRFSGINSGADYLKHALARLQKRSDSPKEILEEPKAQIAGMVFDRVCLKRSWGDAEVGMTYWVSLKRGHAVIFTGSYASREGLQAVEALLAKASELP